MNNPTFTQNAPAVYLVGAGPGDASLLTIRAAYLLKHASCVIYDYLVSDEIVGMCNAHAECIFVGKKGFTQHVTQDEINALLVEKARQAQEAAAGMRGGTAAEACNGAAAGARAGSVAEACGNTIASRSLESVPNYECEPAANDAAEQVPTSVPNYASEQGMRPYVVRLKGG